MNKDVVYIEPEDDITDIITRIEGAKGKIVALVPPKKAGVFRSIVNIKLIAKAGRNAAKTVVLVTTDPSIIKLAAATKLPVAKSLQSAPVVPDGANLAAETTSRAEIVENDGSEETDTENGDSEGDSSEVEDEEPSDGGLGEESVSEAKNGLKTEIVVDEGGENGDSEGDFEEKSDKNDEPDKKDKKSTKKDRKEARKNLKKFSKEWLKAYKWWFIGGGIGVVALILLLVWMFVIAPRADIAVEIRTTTANFSENITFTGAATEEDAEKGIFYIVEKKLENKSEVEFEATGQKNVGEKATGKVQIYAYLKSGESATVKSGTTLTAGGKNFAADTEVTLAVGSNSSAADCANSSNLSQLQTLGCLVYGSVEVTATESGSAYNVNSTDWKISTAGVGATSGSTTGGTDEYVTVVQQSDIDKAKEQLKSSDSSKTKAQLFNTIDDNNDFVIESSYEQTVSDAVSKPALGEEVKSGEKAKLTVVTTDSVYVIDKVKVEEFIAHTAKLADGFKIYSMNDPFIENFAFADGSGTGKLKTSYVSGLSITENEIVEMSRGKGVGTATHDISDLEGIKSVTIDTPYFWVSTVPDNPDRISVKIDTGEYE